MLLLAFAIYWAYDWYIAEPDNKEPLPALLSFVASFVTLLLAWQNDNQKNDIRVGNIDKSSTVDIDNKNSNIRVSNIKNDSKVFINKGKDSLKK